MRKSKVDFEERKIKLASDLNYEASRSKVDSEEIKRKLISRIRVYCEYDGTLSVYASNTEVMKELIDDGANVNAKDRYGKTLLMYASNIEVVKELIDAGADVNAKDKDGKTALIHAIAQGNTEVVKELIQRGANVNARDINGKTALMYAIEQGNIDIVKRLIEAEADVDVRDKRGKTALMYACERGNIEVVKELIDAGANVHARDKYGVTVLIYARYGHNNIDVMRELMQKMQNGASMIHTVDIDEVDIVGKRALMYAYEQGNKDLVKELIEAGADVNAVYEGGNTLLKCFMGELQSNESNKSKEDKIEYMAMLIRGGVYPEDILEEVKRMDREERMDELDIIIEGITRESYDLAGHMREVVIKGACDKKIKDYFRRIDRLNELSKGLRLMKYKSTRVKEKVFSDIENSGLVNGPIIELVIASSQVEKSKSESVDETDKERVQEKKDRRKKVNELAKEEPQKEKDRGGK